MAWTSDKFADTRSTIMRLFTTISELEHLYAQQRMKEEILGKKNNSPLKPSRVTLSKLHRFILKARAVERRYNREVYDEDEKINLVEEIIFSDDNFPVSKLELRKIYSHRDSIAEGKAAKQREEYVSNLVNQDDYQPSVDISKVLDFLGEKPTPKKLETPMDLDAVMAAMEKKDDSI